MSIDVSMHGVESAEVESYNVGGSRWTSLKFTGRDGAELVLTVFFDNADNKEHVLRGLREPREVK